MFTVNIKRKQNPKNENLVKLELIFFKTDYARKASLEIEKMMKEFRKASLAESAKK